MSPNLFNTLHFLVLHFPIALLILSFVLDLIAAIWKRSKAHDLLHKAGFLTLLFGTFMSIITVLSGFIAAQMLGVGAPIIVHASKAVFVTSYAIFLSFIRCYFVWKLKKDISDHIFYLVAAFAGILLVFTQFKVYRFSHFALLQFTVPLIISGFIADIIAMVGRNKNYAEDFKRMGYYFLILGTVAIIGTVISGYMRAAAMPTLNPPRVYDETALQAHELFGLITMGFFILLSAVRSVFFFKADRAKIILKGQGIYVVALIAGIAIISWASHLGGEVHLFPALFK
ncbi:DUF2231 domain-containing protein [Sporolactobacillus sp. THM19-2]|jgi:uncharacterized membrane protein|uniref:DUF2231 domain-containing protein n=1 Tax=Sporolactobacillus sp. THM19-2 TaxID=2511171 RepID=UPI001F0D7307|nr:DUF2231 domain-containing protein [Sporolactobacillus sp. THM19-2]